jgi:hypothetical protein
MKGCGGGHRIGSDRVKCAACHKPSDDHGVRTAWGFLALRLPEDDEIVRAGEEGRLSRSSLRSRDGPSW